MLLLRLPSCQPACRPASLPARVPSDNDRSEMERGDHAVDEVPVVWHPLSAKKATLET